jgi:putative phosphoesterase
MGFRAVKSPLVIGVISDTHGYMDPRVFSIFEGVDHILHAGDLGAEEVAIELEALAPLTAVSGNVDAHLPPGRFPPFNRFKARGWNFLISHQALLGGRVLEALEPNLKLEEPDLVIFGHTHRPFYGWVGGRYFFNPGAAGRKRFQMPRTVGRLVMAEDGALTGSVISLEGEPKDEGTFEFKGPFKKGPR